MMAINETRWTLHWKKEKTKKRMTWQEGRAHRHFVPGVRNRLCMGPRPVLTVLFCLVSVSLSLFCCCFWVALMTCKYAAERSPIVGCFFSHCL